ncbi:protein kinase [Archangium violaceum]|uniref:serine/threonine-protein kinase n=1 Tax=Archangium violaceum TaxID=83451 RepID=UPI00194E24C3|nr:serine/threonine-protein kinase [Archangium violaceum]QRN95813.1 protein kinase [Archangium violaceum]
MEEKTVVHDPSPAEPVARTAPGAGSEMEEMAWESTVRKDVLVGQRIGEYVVRRRIGSGGMGVVYEGEHPVIGRKVAIKIIRPDSSEGVRSRELVGEARAAGAIRHRGIIDIFGFGTLPGIGQYLVMEYLNGRPLDEVILDRAPMPPAEVIRLMLEVLGALAAAHAEGVIHRDLKPGNIFVVLESNGSEYVKVLDFGLAKQGAAPNSATPQTRASMIVGTPEYMAPEQACGQPVSPRTDLYAVGIIMFEMLTGRLPFRGDSPMQVAIMQVQAQPPAPSSLVDGLPAELDALILRMLAKDADQRPVSADAVARELKGIAKMLAVDMTQLSGFARAVPESAPAPQPNPTARPQVRQQAAGAAPQRAGAGARPAAAASAPETAAAARTGVNDGRPALAAPSPEVAARISARPQAARPAPRPQAARPVPRPPPPTTETIVRETRPEVQAPDTHELALPRRSLGTKVVAGLGVAAVLIGAGVGVVYQRDGGPTVPTVTPAPVIAPPQAIANPPAPQKQPEPPAQVEAPTPQKTVPEESEEKNATSDGTRRSAVMAKTGSLQIVSECWAKVYVNGEFKGEVPRSTPIILSVGAHKLELRESPAIENPRAEVSINPGKNKYVARCRPSEG